MLRWRLPLAVLFIAILAALGYADAYAGRAGIYLAPLAVLLAALATGEMLRLFRAGLGPGCLSTHGQDSHKVYYFATLLPVLASCAPLAWKEYPEDCPVGRLGWLALGLLAGLLVVVLSEMKSFQASGESITRLALGSLSVLYVGGLFGMIVQLRLLPGNEALHGGQRGLVALLSMIVIVKASDIGQYTFGRLCGKHKLAPALSPGKTWEGALGGVATAMVVAVVVGRRIMPTDSASPVLAALVPLTFYAASLAVAGILGDLAESLLKRDAGVKDSSDWLPGFGGILDLVDSLLFAAPVAYLLWVSGMLA